MKFGTRLRQLREERGLTQDELASKLNHTQSSIAYYENGSRQPGHTALIQLADFFHVSVDYLLCRTDNKAAIETIAAHRGGEGHWTPEELEDIERFKEFVRMKREQQN